MSSFVMSSSSIRRANRTTRRACPIGIRNEREVYLVEVGDGRAEWPGHEIEDRADRRRAQPTGAASSSWSSAFASAPALARMAVSGERRSWETARQHRSLHCVTAAQGLGFEPPPRVRRGRPRRLAAPPAPAGSARVQLSRARQRARGLSSRKSLLRPVRSGGRDAHSLDGGIVSAVRVFMRRRGR